MSDWIKWGGGDCPVAPGTKVRIRLRCGLENRGEAGKFNWKHGLGAFGYEGDDDILAYLEVEA